MAVSAVGMLLSVTVIVTENVPGAVGVPLMVPVEPVSDSPAGSAPALIDQV